MSKWAGGSTSELFIFPPDASYSERNFSVRISSATIDETPSAFTLLPLYRRVLMPVSAPLTLFFEKSPAVRDEVPHETDFSERYKNDMPAQVLLKPFAVAEFEGGWKTTSHGLCTDIGVMFVAGWKGRLQTAKNGTCKCPSGFTCVYALCDNIEITASGENYTLLSGDFFILQTNIEEEIIINPPAPNTAVIATVTKEE